MLTSLFSEVELDRDEMESHYFNACFEEFSVSITQCKTVRHVRLVARWQRAVENRCERLTEEACRTCVWMSWTSRFTFINCLFTNVTSVWKYNNVNNWHSVESILEMWHISLTFYTTLFILQSATPELLVLW